MKLTALLLTVAFLQVHASGSGQSVTIAGKDMPLKHVFTAIKQQTGFVVFYNKDILDNTKPVTLSAYNMPLNELLTVVFRDQAITYTIQEKTIILSHRVMDATVKDLIILAAPSVSGQIVDMDNAGLTNVSIRIRGTKKGTTSGSGGIFSLDVKEGEVLELSAVGYTPIAIRLSGDFFQVVPVERSAVRRHQTDSSSENKASQLVVPNKDNVYIKLVRSNSILDEVVIIPYGKTSKRFATGNVTSIKAKEIERQPVMNVMQALEGKVPGMNISSLSGNSAAPIKVEIRGRSSINAGALVEPLYIIDGIPLTTLEIGTFTQGRTVSTGALQSGRTNTPGESPLLFLNPRDIESVDVLKDADATAIYGSRGANGVILITTKRSKPGPTRFNMNITNGIQTAPRRLPLMNTEQYLAVRREAYRNDRLEPNKYDAPDLTIWDQHRYTDWQRELIGTGNSLNIDARVSGGLAQTSYSIGANYFSQKEIMNNGGKNIRGGFTLTLNHTSLNQKFQIDAVSRIAITDVNAYRVEDIVSLPPNAPAIYDENGDFNFEPYRGQYSSNFPFAGLKQPSESKSTILSNSLTVRYELVRGLTLSTTAGYNFTNNKNAMYSPEAALDPAFFPPFFPPFISMSSAIFGNSSNNNWTVEPQLQYTALFGKGNLSILAGASIHQVIATGMTTLAQSFPNDNLMRSINNAGMHQSIDSRGDYKYNAAFSIINFRWDNKYIINLSARRDGSSRFGPGRQFGNFGSVGLAWIASDEKWLQSVLPTWVSFLKFRSSYGITGKDGVPDYGYITRWSSSYDLGMGEKIWDYNGSPGFSIAGPINPEYGWEATKKLEVAGSVSLFKDRINLEASWYQNRSGNQLSNIATPLYTGFPSVTANWDAVVQNSGIELSLSARLVQTKDWNINVNANISRNRNKLVAYPGFEYSPYATTYQIGKPLSTIYLLHYTGIDPLSGTFTFEDRNKNGQIYRGVGNIPVDDHDDRYIGFDYAMRYQGGFGTTINYKNFSVYAHFVFKKQPGLNPYNHLIVGSKSNYPLPKEIAENHWQAPGDQALYPRYTATGRNGNIGDSDGGWADASYVRMNTLSLSYDLPAKWLQKIKMQGCRFSVNTQNLFVITSYKGIDPEVQSLNGATPISRAITTNLSFNF